MTHRPHADPAVTPRLSPMLGTLAVAAALSACAASTPTRFHMLQSVAATQPVGTYAGPPLQLLSVTVPAALDRAELLQPLDPGQFEVRDFDHWAAPLSQLARTALSEDLALRLQPGRVVFPGASWPVAGADLRVQIQSFQVSMGRATMQLSWSVRMRTGSGSEATDSQTPAGPTAVSKSVQGAQLRLEVPAGATATATAQAFGALLAQSADRIVATLGTAASAPSP